MKVKVSEMQETTEWYLNWLSRNPNPNTEVWKKAIRCWTSHCWLWCKFAHSHYLSDIDLFPLCKNKCHANLELTTAARVNLIYVTQDMGPHIFQTCPSANYFDCKAMSIGARSQSARTYLERCMDKFSDCKMEFDFLILYTLISLLRLRLL